MRALWDITRTNMSAIASVHLRRGDKETWLRYDTGKHLLIDQFPAWAAGVEDEVRRALGCCCSCCGYCAACGREPNTKP